MGVGGPAELHFEAVGEAVADQQVAGRDLVLARAGWRSSVQSTQAQLDRDMAAVDRAGRACRGRAGRGRIRAALRALAPPAKSSSAAEAR